MAQLAYLMSCQCVRLIRVITLFHTDVDTPTPACNKIYLTYLHLISALHPRYAVSPAKHPNAFVARSLHQTASLTSAGPKALWREVKLRCWG